MGGIRFIKLNLTNLSELNDYHPAETYYQYLQLCNNNPYIPKDEDGYFVRSVDQIYQVIRYKRYVQEKARCMLVQHGWISCRIEMQQRSPAMAFKIMERK